MAVDMGRRDCGDQNRQYPLGRFFSKTGSILAHGHEQSNGISAVLVAFDAPFGQMELPCLSRLHPCNIFCNPRRVLSDYRSRTKAIRLQLIQPLQSRKIPPSVTSTKGGFYSLNQKGNLARKTAPRFSSVQKAYNFFFSALYRQ